MYFARSTCLRATRGAGNPNLQAPVVQTSDSAIHRINHYPADSVIDFRNTYPLDSDLASGQRYPTFEQPGPGQQVIVPEQKLRALSYLKKVFCNLAQG